MKTIRRLLTSTTLGRYLLVLYRLWTAVAICTRGLSRIPHWLLSSRELDNFTYDIIERDRHYIASLTALLCEVDEPAVAEYLRQCDEDLEELRSHVRHITTISDDRHTSDPDAKSSGKRMLWYALTRAKKPKLVVEVGVKRGTGTCLIAAALKRNSAEGHPGRILGLDIDPRAGCLIRKPYDGLATLLLEDCIHYLMREPCEPIDIYIDDAIADIHLQAAELKALHPRLTKDTVISINYHSEQLLAFAWKIARRYVVYRDEPRDFWFPGQAIALLFTFPPRN